jgi:ATP-dependent DNA helicase RecG
MTKDKLSTDANTRINAMVKLQDGFELAEVDLKLRGPGNLMGTQQSGVLQMIIADLTEDASILENARKAALNLLHKDPNINSKVNSAITSTLLQLERGKGIWKYIS